MTSRLGEHAEMMARLQEQIASGVRVRRASDGPTDAAVVLSLRAQTESLQTYDKNLDLLTTDLEQAAAALQEVGQLVGHVRERITQAASGTYDAPQRVAMAEEIAVIIDQVVALANTQYRGRHLFGGTAVTAAPYDVSRAGGKVTDVRYQGAQQTAPVPVAPGVQHPATLVGDAVFRRDERQAPAFLGDTGAAPGQGTSSVRGDVWLTVAHDTTTYGGATGVATGASSALGDTIVGAHQLTLDADNNRVRLDEGAWKSFDPDTDDDLALTNDHGDLAYVDLTGLAGGLSGTHDVDATATAKLSIDDMASSVTVTAFTDNETVTDSRSGRILYVDATALARVGLEPVRAVGTYDVFGALLTARDLLTNERDLSDARQAELLSGTLASLDEVAAGVSEHTTAVGARIQAVDSLRQTLEDLRLNLDARRGQVQEADIVQIATELARAQTFYEMLLTATAKVLNLSLLNYL
jgi:flagellar hook-associated protein 3